jgi:hypothetical protein
MKRKEWRLSKVFAGLAQDLVDDAVVDIFMEKAGAVNNEGFLGQVYFLLSEGWTPEDIRDDLTE